MEESEIATHVKKPKRAYHIPWFSIGTFRIIVQVAIGERKSGIKAVASLEEPSVLWPVVGDS